ncbi:uncharacterized protein LOC115230180 [Argonauta hians]
MSMKALKKALELFEESPSSLSKGMKLDAKSTNKVKKKRKKHKSVVEKFREAQPGSFLKGNLSKLHNCSITRQLVSEPINEIIKNNSDSKKPFIHGKKYSAKRKKKKNKAAANKSVFDESDFEKFFQEYFPK